MYIKETRIVKRFFEKKIMVRKITLIFKTVGQCDIGIRIDIWISLTIQNSDRPSNTW